MLSRKLAAAMCGSTTLEQFRVDSGASLHEAFYSVLAEQAENCQVRKFNNEL